VAVPRNVPDAEGGEIWAAPALRAYLDDEVGGLLHVRDAWREALPALGLSPAEVAHGTVFTTQSLFHQDRSVAEQVRARGATLERVGDCVAGSGILSCHATIEVYDFLGEDGHLDPGEL